MNTWGDRHKRWRVHRMQGKLISGTQGIKPCGECIRFGLKETCCDGMEMVGGNDQNGYVEDCWRPRGTVLVWNNRLI